MDLVAFLSPCSLCSIPLTQGEGKEETKKPGWGELSTQLLTHTQAATVWDRRQVKLEWGHHKEQNFMTYGWGNMLKLLSIYVAML